MIGLKPFGLTANRKNRQPRARTLVDICAYFMTFTLLCGLLLVSDSLGSLTHRVMSAGSTRIAAVPADVSFPSAEVAFIAGPQVTSGFASISGASWFDQNALDRGTSLCTAFPDLAQTPGNMLISGTVSVTNGTGVSQCVSGGVTHESCKVHGTGTHFLTDAKDYAIISNGTGRRLIKIVAGVQSDTELTLTLPWEGTTASGRTISSPTASDVDNYQGYQMYYDFALTQYVNYYRTGDTAYRDCARKAADSWYSQPIIDEGKNLISVSGEGLAPRMVAINGLMLRALDGRPEMWPWIKDYVDYQFHLWDEIRIDYPGLYFGVRDGGFMMLYAANMAVAHPDASVRADFNTRALAVAKNYYARLQQSDGSYRWNDEDFPFTGAEQPFQVGILNEAMIQVHRLTGDATVRAAILKSADHEFTKSYKLSGWLAMYYFIHGAIGAPPVDCETGCGSASNPFPPSDTSLISEARQLNATTIHVFGYAFLLTGDTKYRDYGDEVFAASYSGTDGYRGLANTRGKEYDESYRAGGRYLAWREAATPTPTPTPPAGDVVWVEDTIPAGATPTASGGDDWTWIGANPAPFSGSLASQSNISSEDHQHYFYGATDTLTINTGDKLFAYVYLDPANVPSEIMLQWNDGDWDHRAYWGANNIPFGTNGTVSRHFMGALPAAGQWVRLEVPASSVGLEGHVLTGMAFTLYGGRATWDHAGKTAQ